MTDPRIIVFAYHDIGFECLLALLVGKANVVAVFTHPDRPESESIWFRSVASLAKAHGIPVYLPKDLNAPTSLAKINALKPDLIFSFYYRAILSNKILQLPALGAFNLHGSLLPTYRGRVPTHWAIINGETKTGVTLHHMTERVDAGDIVDQRSIEIGPQQTSKEVISNLAIAAGELIQQQLPALLSGTTKSKPQDDTQASYFGGRKPEDGRIDWHQSAKQIFNLIRATTHPYPGAFTEYEQEYFYIWWAKPIAGHQGVPGEIISENPLRIATGDGQLEIIKYQWENKPICVNQKQHGLKRGKYLGETGVESATNYKS